SSFVIGGIGLIHRGGYHSVPIGWLSVIFFGIGVLISILMLIPGLNALVLSPEGFTLRWIGRVRSPWKTKWQDVSDFSVMELKPGLLPPPLVHRLDMKFAGISFTPRIRDMVPQPKLAKMDHNRKKYGCDGMLPDTFGMSAEELVTLLQEWKRK